MAYSERVTPHPGYFVAIVFLIPLISTILAPRSVALGLVVGPLVFLVVLLVSIYASPKLEVSGGVFRAGRARIPVQFLGEPVLYTGDEAVAQRGTELDARAYLCIRGGSMPMLRIPNTDPNDPCPYWLVSTRHPQQLVAALTAEHGKLAGDRATA